MMRKIINFEKGKSISIEGDGIKYTFDFSSFKIELEINPDVQLKIGAKIKQFLSVEPGSKNHAEIFQEHLNSGYLTLEDYKWLNSWCYTRKFGAGWHAIHQLESDIFAFKLGEKLKGTIDGTPIYKTPHEIFNMFVEKANREFQIK